MTFPAIGNSPQMSVKACLLSIYFKADRNSNLYTWSNIKPSQTLFNYQRFNEKLTFRHTREMVTSSSNSITNYEIINRSLCYMNMKLSIFCCELYNLKRGYFTFICMKSFQIWVLTQNARIFVVCCVKTRFVLIIENI